MLVKKATFSALTAFAATGLVLAGTHAAMAKDKYPCDIQVVIHAKVLQRAKRAILGDTADNFPVCR